MAGIILIVVRYCMAVSNGGSGKNGDDKRIVIC